MDINTFRNYISRHDVVNIKYGGHEYTISEIEYPSNSYGRNCFDCFCIDRDDEIVMDDRTFKIESIQRISSSTIEDDDDTSISRFIYLSRQYNVLFMGYTNGDGEYHEMNISDITYPCPRYGEGYFRACCTDENGESEEERTFKISRIDFIRPSDFDEFDEDEDEYED